MSVAGFSINILTLFALVLAIGTVVDDAIIVVEAVQAKFDVGYRSPYLATKDAMSDVTMAVVSCTFVFMAVFIPVTFMEVRQSLLYSVWYYHGSICRNFLFECLDTVSGIMCHNDEACKRREKRSEYKWQNTCCL